MKCDKDINKKACGRKTLMVAILFSFLLTATYLMPFNSHALIGIKEGDIPKGITLGNLNGIEVNVADYFGKAPVILVFWELQTDKSFLNYSLDELTFLNNFYEKYHEESGLEIFGIYTPEEDKNIPESEISSVQNLIKVNRIKFPVLIDGGLEIFREYGVIALPSTVMIDKTGKIRFIYPSFPIAARPLLSRQIKDLIGIEEFSGKMEEVKTKGHDSHSRRLYHYSLQMCRKGLFQQALSPLEKSLKLDPDFAWSHNLMGIILWKKNNFNGAVEEFNHAIKLDVNNAPAHFNYGLLLFENEKYSEAEKHFTTSIALDNTMAGAHYILGFLYKKTDRTDEALNELKKALNLFEEKGRERLTIDSSTFQLVSTLYGLSELYKNMGDDKRAIELLQKAARVALGIGDKTEGGYLDRGKDLMIYE